MRNFIYSPLVLVVLGLIVILFARSVWQAYAKERTSRIGEYNASAELADLKERQEKMEGRLEQLQTEDGIEAELRGKYGVGREGEEMIIITEEKKTQ